MISPHTSFPWKTFIFRVVLPTVLTFILFISAFFFVIIPTVRKSGMERKKEMIRELTTSAWNILATFHESEETGAISREKAQDMAIEQIKNFHYGQYLKDYFWINDMTPKMITHPYRHDLIGKDLSEFEDSDGKKIFMEILKVAEETGSGYVSYKWTAIDDLSVVLPKISYVKVFKPWGWVIGTGVFIHDVNAEINLVIRNILAVSTLISIIIILLFAHIIRVTYVTHKKQRAAELELKRTKSSLVLSEKMASLGRLAAMVAHEINNPLSGILSYSRLSARHLAKEPLDRPTAESVIENLEVISSETKRCGEIVKNLLLFSKQSMGDLKQVHVNEIVSLSVKVIDHSAKMKNIDLITDLGAGDDSIFCDPGSIQQILVSLIVNSIESSSEGKTIRVETDYSSTESISIHVIDQGHGIHEKDLPFIFDPFFSTKDSNSSLGLGLSTVYGIVQSHGGSIQVKSDEGHGTKFIVTLSRVSKWKE